jgi:hypothetical protein
VRWLESLALAHEASQWLQQSASAQTSDTTAPAEAPLSVRFDSVTIAVPAHKAKYLKMDTPVKASVVELREEGSSGGKGICWRLLSTLSVDTLEAAVRLARWYAKRWQIEEFHRILKTGCRVEARQMRSLGRLKPMMAMDMMVACRIMGMSAASPQRPEDPASDWLDEDEISALEAYENAGEKTCEERAADEPGSSSEEHRTARRTPRTQGRRPSRSASAVARYQQARPRSPRSGADSATSKLVGKAQGLPPHSTTLSRLTRAYFANIACSLFPPLRT